MDLPVRKMSPSFRSISLFLSLSLSQLHSLSISLSFSQLERMQLYIWENAKCRLENIADWSFYYGRELFMCGGGSNSGHVKCNLFGHLEFPDTIVTLLNIQLSQCQPKKEKKKNKHSKIFTQINRKKQFQFNMKITKNLQKSPKITKIIKKKHTQHN